MALNTLLVTNILLEQVISYKHIFLLILLELLECYSEWNYTHSNNIFCNMTHDY